MDCLFCKIGSKEIPSETVYEDDHAIGILDVHPKAPGHAMILPKTHYETILDVPVEELGPIFAAVKRVTEMLQKTFAPGGFTIGINQGKASGQAVDHLHIHVIPRFENDGGGSIHSVVDNPPVESQEVIAVRIKESAK